jgi:mRNA-degrading endonuclease RelE of RelBE toxin-antitoxin system
MSEVVRQTIRAVRRVSTESGNKALNELGEGKIELASPARLYKVESPAVEEVEGTFTTTTATKEGQIDIPAGTVVEHIHIDKKKSDRTTEESEVVTFQVEPMADNETSIISVVDNNRVGSLTLVPTEGGYRVNTISVSPEYQGNNIAKEMYREANEKLEGQIFSDVVQTEAAAGVWNSLVETGEATALEDGTFVMTEPKEVEVTEETSKELRDLPKKDLKQLERDAVQNSDAQVVKLVTRVGNKDVTQYIVKDDVLRLSIEETTDQVANQEIMNLDFEISRLIESGQIEATCKL